MGRRWDVSKALCIVLLIHVQALVCLSLNLEGTSLELGSEVEDEPCVILNTWDPEDNDTCNWSGINCSDGNLEASLLCDDRFQGGTHEIQEIKGFSELKSEKEISSDVGTRVGCNRKVGCWLNFKTRFSRGHGEGNGDNLLSFSEQHIMQSVQHNAYVRRRLLQDTSNLPAMTVKVDPPTQGVVTVPSTGSGSFPAIPHGNRKPVPPSSLAKDPPPTPNLAPLAPSTLQELSKGEPPPSNRLGTWGIVMIIAAIVLAIIIAAIVYFMCRSKGVAPIGPWKTGISGQLQKAFVTGVPKLNREELEAACEDFSNIIDTFPHCTVFKGTLSNGVEISVASTGIKSAKDWSQRSEMCFRRKIDALSRINHKNFVNLIGYCEEDEPFMRMMVFEYATSGSLYEHLHGKDFEHLDWNTRTRIIMGIGYCLQYLHHELNPPLAHPDLQTNYIFLTDDYASKVSDGSVWKEVAAGQKMPGDDDMDPSESPYVDTGSNVYSFAMIMLEIISGKLPNSADQHSLLNSVSGYLEDKGNAKSIVDSSLKNFKDNELDVICKIIHECINEDPKTRLTMKEVMAKLREVIAISPEAATPRLSPLWWAELEILSMEAS